MVKQRASIRRRGATIVSDGSAEVEEEPREPAGVGETPSPQESGKLSALRQKPSSELQEEAALYEEASSGAPPPEGVGARPNWLHLVPPPTPEMEVAFIEEAYAAQAPPDPVAETPAPTMEVMMREQKQDQEQAFFEAPPPEVEDVSNGVLPPRPSPPLTDLHADSPTARDIQEPEEEVKPIELPERELTEEEKAAVLAWLTEERFQELGEEITKTYEEIGRRVAVNESVANKAFNNLLKARDILVRRDAAKISQAEYYIEQTQALLERVSVSEAAAKKYQWRLLAWGLFWALAYLGVLVLLSQEWLASLITSSAINSSNLIDIEVFVAAMIWGGIGGAVAILYSLFKHIGARDFDPHYGISYIGKPFLGVVLGATAYMVLNLLIRVLGIFPIGMEGEGGAAPPTVAPGVIYLVAWASGFKENRILDLVDRAMKRIFSGRDEGESAPNPSQMGLGA